MPSGPTVEEGEISVSHDPRDQHGTIDDVHFGVQRGEARVAGFAFGSSTLDKIGKAQLESQFEKFKQYVDGTNHKIILRGYASNPGTNSANITLSAARAVSVRDWLVSKGIDADRITVRALGEDHIAGPTKMAEEFEPLDNFDDPDQRTVTLEISTVAPEPDPVGEVREKAAEIKGGMDDAKEFGRDIFYEVVEPYADLVRKEAGITDNPFGAGPSDNPGEFLDQVVDIGKETLKALRSPKDLAKLVAKYGGGGVADLITSGQSAQVYAARMPLYEAIASAFAARIDPNFNVPTDFSPQQKALFDAFKARLALLTPAQLASIGLFLSGQTEGLSVTGTSSDQAVIDSLDGATIMHNAMGIFSLPVFAFKDSHDDGNLTFELIGIRVRVVTEQDGDFAEPVQTSSDGEDTAQPDGEGSDPDDLDGQPQTDATTTDTNEDGNDVAQVANATGADAIDVAKAIGDGGADFAGAAMGALAGDLGIGDSPAPGHSDPDELPSADSSSEGQDSQSDGDEGSEGKLSAAGDQDPDELDDANNPGGGGEHGAGSSGLGETSETGHKAGQQTQEAPSDQNVDDVPPPAAAG